MRTISMEIVHPDTQSNNGGEFKNGTMDEICKLLGMQHHLCTPYYHEGNGIAETMSNQHGDCQKENPWI